MNNCVLYGRLTKDPVVRYTQGDKSMCIARFTLAVDRRGRKEDGKPSADFPNCIAFGKNGEFFEKYGKKGGKFLIRGHIQTGSYEDKDGKTVFTTDVVVDEQEFGESKAAAAPAPAAKKEPEQESFMDIPSDVGDEGLPWNA